MRQMRRGLTLIEMIITIAVLSIAVTIIVPSMNSTGVVRVQAALRMIASDIATAQTEAMAYQVRRGIWFGVKPVEEAGETTFTNGNGYVMLEPTGTELTMGTLRDYMLYMPNDPSRPYARVFEGDSAFGGAVISSATFGSGSALYFDELGGPLASLSGTAPGSGGVIRVDAEQYGRSYEIRVQAMTGRVEIVRVTAEGEEESGGG